MSNILDQLKPLFAGAYSNLVYNDNRNKLLSHFLLKINPLNFVQGFNNQDPNLTPLKFNEFMIVKNYELNTVPSDAEPNDIHPEIYSFFEDMANYHKVLNKNKESISKNIHQKNLHDFLQNIESFESKSQAIYESILNLVKISDNSVYQIKNIVGLKNLDEYRINIKTLQPGKLIFLNIIPKIGNWSTKIWIDKNKSVMSSINYFVELYQNVYDQLLEIPSYQAPRTTLYFSLNLSQYLLSLIPSGNPIVNTTSQISLPTKCSTINSSKSCNDYVKDCLKGVNLEECEVFFKSKGFWDQSQIEIQDISPEVALKTLISFKFIQTKVFDRTANQELLKVESLNQWLRRLPELIASEDIQSTIRNNTKLKAYLGGIIKLVNKNPNLMNDYSGPVDESLNNDPEHFDATKLAKSGIKVKYLTTDNFHRHIDYVTKSVKNSQRGGALKYKTATDLLEYKTYFENYNSYKFRELFKHLKIKLRSYKKDIKYNDWTAINALIIDLYNSETEIFNIIKLLEAYSSITNVYDLEKESISLDEMQESVEKEVKIKKKKEDTILKFLKKIAKQI